MGFVNWSGQIGVCKLVWPNWSWANFSRIFEYYMPLSMCISWTDISEYRNKSSLFKPSVTQHISQTNYDLNTKLLVSYSTHVLNNELLVCYSSHDLNNEPFNEQTTFDRYRTSLLFRSPLYLTFISLPVFCNRSDFFDDLLL